MSDSLCSALSGSTAAHRLEVSVNGAKRAAPQAPGGQKPSVAYSLLNHRPDLCLPLLSSARAGWKHHVQGIISSFPVGWLTQLGLETGPRKDTRDCELQGARDPTVMRTDLPLCLFFLPSSLS